MPRWEIKPRPWKIRTRLLLPIIILVVLVAALESTAGILAARHESHDLIQGRGTAVLNSTMARLSDRRRSKEVYAQLLAEQPGLATAVSRHDEVGVAQTLLALTTRLGLGYVTIYGDHQKVLLYHGPGTPDAVVNPLISTALSGLTQSQVDVDDAGLIVSASSPIKGDNGIVGVIVVGVVLDNAGLEDLASESNRELAVFQAGRLKATTVTRPEIRKLLEEYPYALAQPGTLNDSLSPFSLHAEGQAFGENDLLLVIVPTSDLDQAFWQLTMIMLVGVLGLIGALGLAGMMLARNIAMPVRGVITATLGMVQGRYHERVPSSQITELNELADSINMLGEKLEIQMAELARQAFYDSLTNLPNRALFVDRVERALARLDRRKNAVAVLFLDLDNFKVVNDGLGHQTGDQLLLEVAERIKLSLRNEDTAARFGGDEFTVLLEDIAGLNEAIHVAERIQEEFQRPFSLSQEVFATASIGIALSTFGNDRPEALLRDADLAMYRAKSNGKAHYEVFDPSLNTVVLERLKLETDLRRAVERQELRLLYQPVVTLETGVIMEVEALVRWEHPERGLLPPGEFIPIAEETGLILPIGQWVLEEACRQAVEWQHHNLGTKRLIMSVNLSARQFQHPSLGQDVALTLRQSGLSPADLRLEITESVMMNDAQAALATLQELRNLGTRLAVDDFGTGYSSLAYLQRFPVDTLKIDRAFVNRLEQTQRDDSIVSAIIAFGKALNVGIIAEGIETARQLNRLLALGCNLGQGYYFSRPVSSEVMAKLLETRLPFLIDEPRWEDLAGLVEKAV